VAGRQPGRDGRVYITLRIDPELVERLDQEAGERCVSRTFLVEKAVDEWLETHEGAA
jgi:predicted transcriptional regulator